LSNLEEENLGVRGDESNLEAYCNLDAEEGVAVDVDEQAKKTEDVVASTVMSDSAVDLDLIGDEDILTLHTENLVVVVGHDTYQDSVAC